MDEGSRWLTYDDAAQALGITPDSVRRLVARKQWPRQHGNDGRTLVAVPLDRLPPDNPSDISPDSTPDTRGDNTPDNPPAVTPDMSAAVAVLERHASRLEGELAVLRTKLEAVEGERDAERARAGRIEVLEAVLDLERQRLAEARQEAERWREAATAPRGLAALLARLRRSSAA